MFETSFSIHKNQFHGFLPIVNVVCLPEHCLYIEVTGHTIDGTDANKKHVLRAGKKMQKWSHWAGVHYASESTGVVLS